MPQELSKIITPLSSASLKEQLRGHPDREFAAYIVRGVSEGFRIGFNSGLVSLKQRSGNMPLADEHPEVVTGYIQKERELGRLMQVKQAEVLTPIHTNPFGVIPKKSGINRWRLILDLSSPLGHSMNDGIEKELASLSYVSVDEVVQRVLRWGRGTLLAKMDVRQAYRNIPVQPEDRRLLGMRWQGDTYVDAVLPFGLRSAPLIFSAVGDAIAWIMEQHGVAWLDHYIDDFITAGRPGGMECARNATVMKAVCQQVGMPIEPEKDEGPATTITFLGLELDTIALEVRLPQEKLASLRRPC